MSPENLKSMKTTDRIYIVIVLLGLTSVMVAQETGISFGKSFSVYKSMSLTSEKEIPIKWINVNTAPDTWHVEKDILVCSGQPIGVMRSEKQYENFILHIEWMHTEAGGNSGVPSSGVMQIRLRTHGFPTESRYRCLSSTG